MPQTTTPTEDQRLTNYEISTIRCLMSMYHTGTWSWEEALVVKAAMVIPEQSDQIAHRRRHGSKGGRPPAFDTADYKGRNVIERGFNNTKQW